MGIQRIINWLGDFLETLLLGVGVVCGIILLMSFLVALDEVAKERARCQSMQGEYGSGKCFKDGKEI